MTVHTHANADISVRTRSEIQPTAAKSIGLHIANIWDSLGKLCGSHGALLRLVPALGLASTNGYGSEGRSNWLIDVSPYC